MCFVLPIRRTHITLYVKCDYHLLEEPGKEVRMALYKPKLAKPSNLKGQYFCNQCKFEL